MRIPNNLIEAFMDAYGEHCDERLHMTGLAEGLKAAFASVDPGITDPGAWAITQDETLVGTYFYEENARLELTTRKRRAEGSGNYHSWEVVPLVRQSYPTVILLDGKTLDIEAAGKRLAELVWPAITVDGGTRGMLEAAGVQVLKTVLDIGNPRK